MAQTNSEYWEQRIANSTWSTYNSLEEKNRALLEMYQEASLNIQEELYQMAQKINNGKGISLSDMHKFNRLKVLKGNFENIMRKLGEDVEKFGKDNMKEGFNKVYNNVMTELGGTDFALPNEKLMEEMMNRPWDGSTFSQRLWKNTQVLASNLNELLTIGLQQGKTVTEIAINLNNRMNTGFNVSHRLVRTETMHYLNESAAKAYEDGGCEEVQLWAAVDERVCDVCGAKHGKTYNIKDRPVLPLHANCRCTYLPVIDKEVAKKEEIKTPEDAKKVLTNKVGFTEVEDSFIENVDPELIIKNTRQLEKLEDKYGIIHSSTSTTICSANRNDDAVAYVANSVTNPTRQSLSLCPNSYSNSNKLISYEKLSTERRQVMPKALNDEELSISSVTHEYGHMLQNKLIKDEMRANGWTPDKPMQFINAKKKSTKAVLKWYTDIETKVKKSCYDEIIDIAKKNNPNFDFESNISKYGKESYGEFFAEVFMNAELSKPNELGLAMRIWLKEKGLGT